MYRDLTSAEKADLFMRIGAVVWFFQYLEDVLVTFLVMKIGYERRRAGTPFSPEEAEEFLADRRRNLTFGPLVDSCVAKDVIRKEWVDRFSNLKNERHWLIHRSIVENADHDMHHEQKRPALLARVGAIRAETMALCRLVGTTRCPLGRTITVLTLRKLSELPSAQSARGGVRRELEAAHGLVTG